ncbi:tripartite tricarboxylate transporter substrate binding protein [Variovorax sp. J2P1-59]|uniref:Bug family tripartite tricarboxylate transporter substrate binding protein n=1 Tax=Variovorax flavidus TaxID=3053501 RepID=UPI002574B524|nr:tripartite tricarboxylate transporter substrate binding protein [Variovorax sp. J2P1-59]MDM0078142.1 tripartite tricarboxylate transporter substrate binding protein [Variovorax sp. J2P1-59]
MIFRKAPYPLGHLARLLLAVLGLSSTAVAAPVFPSRPITLIVPYAPGGAADILARALQSEMSVMLGQPVIVDNKPGAGGNIGADLARRATPDGHTLLFSGASLASNPALMRAMPFTPIKSLTPVAGPMSLQHIVVVHPELPINSIKELITQAKSRPGKLFYGSSGQGTSNHLAVELFKTKAGADLVHVPYKSSGAAIPALMSGEIQLMFDLLPSSIAQVKAGRLRALAVTGANRLPSLPDVPTVAESGLPGYEYMGWFGVFAPAGTPTDVVIRVNAAVNAAVAGAAFQTRLEQYGGQAGHSTPESFAVTFRGETTRWARLVKDGRLSQID